MCFGGNDEVMDSALIDEEYPVIFKMKHTLSAFGFVLCYEAFFFL